MACVAVRARALVCVRVRLCASVCDLAYIEMRFLNRAGVR
jgi:hypothetical protein